MQKEIELDGRKYILREMLFEEGMEMFAEKNKNQKELNFELIKKSLIEPILSDEEIKKLPLRVGLKLTETINELNGFDKIQNFQMPRNQG